MLPEAVQRWRDRRGAWRPASELIQPSRYTVDVIERTTAARFVEAHHYSGSYVASRLQVGLFEGAELVGVAAFSVGVQPKAVPRVNEPSPTEVGDPNDGAMNCGICRDPLIRIHTQAGWIRVCLTCSPKGPSRQNPKLQALPAEVPRG